MISLVFILYLKIVNCNKTLKTIIMKPTCFANTNTIVIKSTECGLHHTIENKFIMMKYTLILLIFVSTLASAQNSWIRELPDSPASGIKMIRTIDNKYAVFITNYTEFVLFKYDDNGTQEWRKHILPEYNYWVNDFTQLSNGQFVFVGGVYINDSCNSMVFSCSESGDSLWMTTFYNEPTCSLYKVIEGNNNEIWATGGSPKYLYKFNTQGDFLDSTETGLNILFRTSTGQYLFGDYTSYPAYYKYQLRDSSLNVLYENINGYRPTVIRETPDGGFILHQGITSSIADEKGLVKLNSSLDSLWMVPFAEYWPYTSNTDASAPNDLIITSEGGYAMFGGYYYVDHTSLYLVKTDEFGNGQFVVNYGNAIPDYPNNLLESFTGGFVMFQNAVETGGTVWLVKSNADGTVNIEDFSRLRQNDTVSVYPNPSSGAFTIQLPENFVGKVVLFDTDGRQLKSVEVKSQTKIDIETGNLAKGIYYIKVIDTDNKTSVKKIIKQ